MSVKPLLHNAWDHFAESLADRQGWRSAVAGIARTDEFLAALEFTDPPSAAAALSDLTVSGWFKEVEGCLKDPETRDSFEGETLIAGTREDAGFIQVIRGRTTDRERWTAINEAMQEVMRTHRPEVLAASIAWFDDDHFSETVFFTSEQEAREGESREFPGGMAGLFGELMNLVEDLTYVDVRDPWIKVHPAIDTSSTPLTEPG
ncbi:MAG: hypothetical protein ACLGHL_02375 [Actinomycetota bacterium]